MSKGVALCMVPRGVHTAVLVEVDEEVEDDVEEPGLAGIARALVAHKVAQGDDLVQRQPVDVVHRVVDQHAPGLDLQGLGG